MNEAKIIKHTDGSICRLTGYVEQIDQSVSDKPFLKPKGYKYQQCTILKCDTLWNK